MHHRLYISWGWGGGQHGSIVNRKTLHYNCAELLTITLKGLGVSFCLKKERKDFLIYDAFGFCYCSFLGKKKSAVL